MWIKVAIHCTALPDATSATAAAAAAAAAAVAGDVICPLICPFSIPECFFFWFCLEDWVQQRRLLHLSQSSGYLQMVPEFFKCRHLNPLTGPVRCL